jgi:hypothetical protein
MQAEKRELRGMKDPIPGRVYDILNDKSDSDSELYDIPLEKCSPSLIWIPKGRLPKKTARELEMAGTVLQNFRNVPNS